MQCLFTSYVLTILMQWILVQYKKETAKQSYPSMLTYDRKKCDPQIQICLFFRHITLKQLNNLTAIDTFSCRGGLEVTHQTAVGEVTGSISNSGKDCYRFCYFCCWCFYFCLNTWFVMQFCNSFCNVDLFRILYILHNLGINIQTKHLSELQENYNKAFVITCKTYIYNNAWIVWAYFIP